MSPIRSGRLPRAVAALAISVLASAVIFSGSPAGAATAPGLGTAGSFAVLAGAGVMNTGPTVVTGDLGTSPTPAITGFPPGIVIGAIHAADAVALQAKADLVTAYNVAAGEAPTVTFAGPTDLGSPTPLVAGVYNSPSSFAITGTVTLDAQGDPNAVFIFQAGSTLITAVDSTVSLINGAQACNVFWQVGSSATLGVDSAFVGTVMALTSIQAQTDATVNGRLLARNASVTLDSNVITRSVCAAQTTPSTGGGTPTTAPGGGTPTTAPGGGTPTTVPGGGTPTTAPGGGTPTTLGGAGGATPTTAGLVALAAGPATPAAPAAPATPGAPAAPVTPAAPATPATPGAPATPATPATPGAPGTPGLATTGADVFRLMVLGLALIGVGMVTVAIGPRLRWPRLH